jgi:hypothetical protein
VVLCSSCLIARRQRAVRRGAGSDQEDSDDDERRGKRRVGSRRQAGREAREHDERRERPVRAGDHRAPGQHLGTAGDGVDRDVGRAGRGAGDREPGAQAREIAGAEREPGADDAQQRDHAGTDAQAPAIERPADEQHRGQRARADEQQRDPEAAVVDAGLVLHSRHRRAPDTPEAAESGEGDVGGRDELAGHRDSPTRVVRSAT